MNEVEKMYENARVESVLFYDCESYNQKVEKYEDFAFDNKQFDEAIAGIINKLWKKIKEVLSE